MSIMRGGEEAVESLVWMVQAEAQALESSQSQKAAMAVNVTELDVRIMTACRLTEGLLSITIVLGARIYDDCKAQSMICIEAKARRARGCADCGLPMFT